MKKKPEKKYAPGELEKTRKSLGQISEEEAKMLSRKLGGEVGVEEDAESVSKKYKDLKTRSYGRVINRNISKSRTKTGAGTKEKSSGKLLASNDKEQKTPAKKKVRRSFMDRVRIDFLCSKSEFRLKPLTGAIASLFSFILPVPDTINPNFIRKSHSLFFTPLYNFVTAVRTLYSKTNPEAAQEISANPFVSKILTTIRNWDVGKIDLELGILRKQYLILEVKRFRKLCKLLYYPFGILIDLDPDRHIKDAVGFAYEANRKQIEKKGGIIKKTRDIYLEALNNIPVVFTNIRKMFYPLLLKLITDKYYPYEEFLVKERANILAFLEIPAVDLIAPEQVQDKTENQKNDEASASAAADVEKEDIIPEIGEAAETESAAGELQKSFYEGARLLELIFPKAGWDRLPEYPDLYPYFQPLFRFPSGFELIPADDPLHQIVIFTAIIGYLLYGFRHIEFQSIRNERLELQSIKSKLDTFMTVWPTYINDVIAKYYVSRLSDYCRHLEKDAGFPKTEIAAKIEMELENLKKTFLLPCYQFRFKRKVNVGAVERNVPKLYMLSSEIRPILSKVNEEINQRLKEKRKKELGGESIKLSEIQCESIKNPWTRMIFDLENPLSKRLNRILFLKETSSDGSSRSVDRRSNLHLINITFTLITMLDDLVNQKSSYFYRGNQAYIFRSAGNDGKSPQYSVPLLEPEKFFNAVTGSITGNIAGAAAGSAGSKKKQTGDAASAKQSPDGHPLHFLSREALPAELKKAIQNTEFTNAPFSVIYFHLFNAKIGGRGKPTSDAIPVFISEAGKIIRSMIDIPFRFADDDFLVILKNTELINAVNAARKVISLSEKNSEFVSGSNRISAGILQAAAGMKYEKLGSIINKIKLVVKNQTSARIVYLDTTTETLKALKPG